MNRHSLLRAVLLACAFASAVALGQDFPSRPVTMVVPFSPGGPVDVLARLLAPSMSRSLGQPVVVEDVVGAAGSIGVGRVAKAAPDGYLLSIGHWGTHVINGAIYPLQYDLLRDLDPISLLVTNPSLIIAGPSVPAGSLSELIAWLKANPDKAAAGTAGVGSSTHVVGVYFQSATSTRFRFIPYKGSAPAIQDLLAGRIDLMFDQASNASPQVRSGKVRAFAVTAKTRLASLPNVPTVDEAGLAGFYAETWYGLWAPHGTPRAAVDKLSQAASAALAEPAIRQRLEELGQQIYPPEQRRPEALREHHKAEIEKWWPLVKSAGIKLE